SHLERLCLGRRCEGHRAHPDQARDGDRRREGSPGAGRARGSRAGSRKGAGGGGGAMTRRSRAGAVAGGLAACLLSARVLADTPGTGGGTSDQAGVTANGLPAALEGVRFDQRLGEQLPLDLAFRDEGGRTVALGEFFGKRPVLLSLGY